jgi:uncharacterized membrane protein
MNAGTTLQIAFVIAGFSILLAYHVSLYYRLRRDPEHTSIGVANQLRVQWVQVILDSNNGILAVQTLRNLTMAASFLASTAIVIALAILNIALHAEEAASLSRVLELDATRNLALWVARLLVLCGDFLFCFFNFMLAIRYYNHSAFMLSQPASEHMQSALHKPGRFIRLPVLKEASPALKSAADTLNRGAAHYTLGMRGYYLVIPLASWLVGALWFLTGAMLLVYVLYRIDRAA